MPPPYLPVSFQKIISGSKSYLPNIGILLS